MTYSDVTNVARTLPSWTIISTIKAKGVIFIVPNVVIVLSHLKTLMLTMKASTQWTE